MHYSSSQSGFILRFLLVVFVGLFLCAWALRAFVLPPANFPKQTTFTIQKGESLGTVAYRLHELGVIKSSEAFKVFMLALGSERDISEGQYYFDGPITSLEVAFKISGREFGILQHKVTFPEGFTNKEMAARLEARFEEFDGEAFLLLVKDDQGYLFPDTYSFTPRVGPEEVVAALKKNFIEKTATMESKFATSQRVKKDIIIMASILEREANDGEEAKIVAGILWKRLDRGIALQVDAPFLFLLGKKSSELTVKDLAIDSPYNTYKYKGLPPAPINNPGLAAIEAALEPIDSPYLYYLHDAQGTIHYARTFEEHKANKEKYL